MSLEGVLQRVLGNCSSWEEAIERMSAAAQTRTPMKEDLLREICDGADPSFAAYFDRQRQKERDAARAPSREPVALDDDDPYANDDPAEAQPCHP